MIALSTPWHPATNKPAIHYDRVHGCTHTCIFSAYVRQKILGVIPISNFKAYEERRCQILHTSTEAKATAAEILFILSILLA